MKKLFFAPWVLTCLRIFLGILFLTAGLGKLVPGFPGLMGPPWLEDVLAKYDLALFARFIAYSQILIGWLLLSRRFATLGALMLLPMLLNILMVTISQDWRGTPYVVSVFLLMNLWLLAADFHRLKFLISDDISVLKPLPIVRKNTTADWLITIGLLLLLTGASFGKIDKLIANTIIGAGLFCGISLPFFLPVLNRRRLNQEIPAKKTL